MARAWTADLTVGDPNIDSQHQELFRRSAALGAALTSGEGRQRIVELLGHIAAYTVSHFRDEEALMAGARYPALSAHRHLHADLVRDVRQVRAQYGQEGASAGVVLQFHNRFGEWLVNHLRGPDGEFARYRAGAPGSVGRPLSAPVMPTASRRGPLSAPSSRGTGPMSARLPPSSLWQPLPPSARIVSSLQPAAPPRIVPSVTPSRPVTLAPATRRSPSPEARSVPPGRDPRTA